jgi:hypothetical protein
MLGGVEVLEPAGRYVGTSSLLTSFSQELSNCLLLTDLAQQTTTAATKKSEKSHNRLLTDLDQLELLTDNPSSSTNRKRWPHSVQSPRPLRYYSPLGRHRRYVLLAVSLIAKFMEKKADEQRSPGADMDRRHSHHTLSARYNKYPWFEQPQGNIGPCYCSDGAHNGMFLRGPHNEIPHTLHVGIPIIVVSREKAT